MLAFSDHASPSGAAVDRTSDEEIGHERERHRREQQLQGIDAAPYAHLINAVEYDRDDEHGSRVLESFSQQRATAPRSGQERPKIRRPPRAGVPEPGTNAQ